MLRAARDKLIIDISWSISILKEWEQGCGMGREYRMVSAATLKSKPEVVYVIQFEAFGANGVGYLYGHIDQCALKYGSPTLGPEGAPSSSHAMEL